MLSDSRKYDSEGSFKPLDERDYGNNVFLNSLKECPFAVDCSQTGSNLHVVLENGKTAEDIQDWLNGFHTHAHFSVRDSFPCQKRRFKNQPYVNLAFEPVE